MKKVGHSFEVELTAFNGERDPVHLSVQYPPKVTLSELINTLKRVFSRKLKQEFKAIREHWIGK